MSDEVTGSVLPPTAPPDWWPGGWPWPPPVYQPADVSQKESWTAKIDREYEHTSDRDQERFWEARRQDGNLADERHDTQTKYSDREGQRVAQNSDRQGQRDERGAKREEENVGRRDSMLDSRLKREDLLITRYLAHADDKHAMIMTIFEDGLSDARLSRSMNYDRQTEKAMNTQLLNAVRDSVSVAIKELMATVPARSGLAAPVTSFQPTPEKSA